MRKMAIVAAFTLVAAAANAQTSFGFHANVISASGKEKDQTSDPDPDVDFKGRISWKIGAVADVPLSETFSFQPQLNLLSKGGKIDMSESTTIGSETYTVTVKGDIKMTYLELPLNFVYHHASGFFIGAGPSLSYGLGGKYDFNTKVTLGSSSEEENTKGDVKFDGDEDPNDENAHFKAFEFGGNILAGYKLANGVFFNLHYNHGFSNISTDPDTEFKNKYVGFGVGIFLGGAGMAKK